MCSVLIIACTLLAALQQTDNYFSSGGLQLALISSSRLNLQDAVEYFLPTPLLRM
jgi:hypothetical protein